MYKLTLALGLLSSAFAAETTTLLLVGFDSAPIDASIIAKDSTATTFGLSCAPGSDSVDCGVPPNFVVTQGPSTMHYKYSIRVESGTATAEAGCKITSDHGFCSSFYADGSGSMLQGAGSAFPYSSFGTDIGAQVVTIVAGSGAPAPASATTTGAAPKTTLTGSSSPSASSSVSTGGMPMVTGHAQWVIGGAAAAAAFAAM